MPGGAHIVLPTFLYIGAEKAGSTWIHKALREHPQVFVPVAKDLGFFDQQYRRGIEWYASFFAPAGGRAKARGEISHNYFLSEETAQRIHKHLPEVKLISCLRNPVDRTISAFMYYRKMEITSKTTFEEFAFRTDILKCSDYYNNLVSYFRLFPKNNISVLLFDDLKADPSKFAKTIYDFIGVDSEFVASVIDERLLPAAEPRWDFSAHLVYKAAQFVRRKGLLNFLGRAKRNPFLNYVLYREVQERKQVPSHLRSKLRGYFEQDYGKLSELIERPLPEAWLSDG